MKCIVCKGTGDPGLFDKYRPNDVCSVCKGTGRVSDHSGRVLSLEEAISEFNALR